MAATTITRSEHGREKRRKKVDLGSRARSEKTENSRHNHTRPRQITIYICAGHSAKIDLHLSLGCFEAALLGGANAMLSLQGSESGCMQNENNHEMKVETAQ
jgi:hypothetical protein